MHFNMIQVCKPYCYDSHIKNFCSSTVLLNNFTIYLWFIDHILSIGRGKCLDCNIMNIQRVQLVQERDNRNILQMVDMNLPHLPHCSKKC